MKLQEKRADTRILISLKLFCRPVSFFNKLSFKEYSIKDVSAGGIFFESCEVYKKNDILLLEIYIPEWDKYNIGFYKEKQNSSLKPLRIIAEVVRVNTAYIGKYYIAVKYRAIDESDKSILKKIINKHLGVIKQ